MFECEGHRFNTLVDCINWIDDQENLKSGDRLFIYENDIAVLVMGITDNGRFWNTV